MVGSAEVELIGQRSEGIRPECVLGDKLPCTRDAQACVIGTRAQLDRRASERRTTLAIPGRGERQDILIAAPYAFIGRCRTQTPMTRGNRSSPFLIWAVFASRARCGYGRPRRQDARILPLERVGGRDGARGQCLHRLPQPLPRVLWTEFADGCLMALLSPDRQPP